VNVEETPAYFVYFGVIRQFLMLLFMKSSFAITRVDQISFVLSVFLYSYGLNFFVFYSVPGQLFDVQEFFLEDVLKWLVLSSTCSFKDVGKCDLLLLK
jgi:hypothetical protein